MSGFAAALAEEQHNFQQATITGDLNEQVRASQAMASLRATAESYHRMSVEHANGLRQAQPSNRYGLSDTEAEIARKSRSDLPRDKAEALYAHNKQKLQTMRANGSYDDGSQGKVFK
jgi:hypothetical protein